MLLARPTLRYHSRVQPLSRWKRRLYLYGLATLFLVVVPFVIFYAAGYRYRSDVGFVQTGGVFVTVAYSGAEVFFDDRPVGTSGILRRNFYIDNLSPDAYTIRVTRPGYRSWSRTLVVEQDLVTTASAFLLPEKIDLVRLTTATSTATSTRTITSATRAAYLQAFSAHASTTPSGAIEEQNGEGLFVQRGDVFVRWMRSGASPPDSYCGRPSYCLPEIPIEQSSDAATRAVFYAGGVVYGTKEHGVYLAEADVRPTPVVVPLYPKGGADFVVVGGVLIVKDGTTLYQVQGF